MATSISQVNLSGMRHVAARIQKNIQAKEMPFYPKGEVMMHGMVPRSDYSYGRDVGDGLRSNVLMAPIRYMMRTFVEAWAVVQTRRASDTWSTVRDHPLEMLIESPNDFYDGDALWQATIISYVLDGNAYWIKVRNAFGDVVQLWYAPHWMIEPKRPYDNSEFITHYDYMPGGETQRLLPRNVVHFRFGLDPRNPQKGLGALTPLLREVFSDEEAAEFSASLLLNGAVPGLVISADKDLNKTQIEEFKKVVNQETSGPNRGGTLALGVPAKVQPYGFDPNKLMLGNLRDITEERVCAMLGIPAAVVGFGSGMQSTKVGATMRELRQSAWTECLEPMQARMAKTLTKSLLSDFVAQRRQFMVWFDRSRVSAFQEEKDALAARVERLVLASILRRDRAQEMLGVEVDQTCKNYLLPSSVRVIDEKGEEILKAPAPSANGTNGNGTKPDGGEDIPPAVAARRNGTSSPNEE